MTEAGEGGGDAPNLGAVAATAATWMGIVDVRIGIRLATALPTVNGPERSVSRESVAAAKRKATAQASITRCWRHVPGRPTAAGGGTENAPERARPRLTSRNVSVQPFNRLNPG